MKTALLVGASSGIGYETARLFLKEKYNVINVSRTPCDLPGVDNRLCDVTDRPALDAVLQAIKEEPIECFIYSAGFSMASPLEFVKEGDYRYLFEVNFFAFMHCLQVLLPVLRQTEGVACVVSSLASSLPIPFDCYYTSSKAALNALIRCLSLELEPENVRVVSVLPGGTKTGFTSKRKIYSPAETDGYAKQLRLSCDHLAKTEQSGMDPQKVAKKIHSACVSPSATVVTPGFINQCARLLSRLLPEKLLFALLKSIFFSQPEE